MEPEGFCVIRGVGRAVSGTEIVFIRDIQKRDAQGRGRWRSDAIGEEMRNQKVVVFIASLEEKDSPEAIHPVPRGFLSLGEIEDSRLKLQAKSKPNAEQWVEF